MKRILFILLIPVSILVAILCVILPGNYFAEKQQAAIIKKGMIMVNHVGFLPNSQKFCVIPDPPKKEFSIHRLENVSWTEVFRGKLTKGGAELGEASVGQFNALQVEGIYQVRCGNLRSRCFVIQKDAYNVPMRVLFNYFPWQRCGDSKTGWAAPCHLDDGIIAETGEHIDVAGGYHQSGDLRKWAEIQPDGLIGLVAFAKSQSPRWGNGLIDEEIRWGCDYYHKLVRKNGSIPHSVFIPIGWGAREWYKVEAPVNANWMVIRYQAMAAEYFKQRDPQYADKCKEIALRVWRYTNSENRPKGEFKAKVLPPLGHNKWNLIFSGMYKGSAIDHGLRLCAALSLFRLTSDSTFLKSGAESATALTNLQVDASMDSAKLTSACFREGTESEILAESHQNRWYPGGPLGLCEMFKCNPEHPDAGKWKRAIIRIAEQHLRISQRNIWGLVATLWYTKGVEPPIKTASTVPGSEELSDGGSLGVMKTNGVERFARFELMTGNYNTSIMAAGLFMLRAAEITGNVLYEEVAQRQLDWIMGCNPFDASAIEGVGYNQPHRGIYGEFFPPTPQIPGAVSTGINYASYDQEGFGLANEYDMPPTGLTLWLMSEIAMKDQH